MNTNPPRLDQSLVRRQASRYLIAGAARTVISLIFYVTLDYFLPYQIAFTIAFILAVLLSAIISSTFVFAVRLTWTSMAAYAFVYIANYLLSLLLLTFLVGSLGVSSRYAFLLIIPAMLPVGFLLERAALVVWITPK